MKKLNYLFLMLVGAFTMSATLTSCKDDDPVDADTSTIFSTSTYETVREDGSGNDVDVTVNQITITDRGEGIGDYSMTRDNVYILDGLVFVNSGQTLNIEAGTIIKANSGQGEEASALVVAAGGTINANGTAANPIIMTSSADDVIRDNGGTLYEGGILSTTTRGLWGGLIILGNASLNSSPGTTAIEGIPTSEQRGIYGGSDDADNSGTVTYVSIRHGGTDIGAGNEINGLTLGGVGSSTVLNHIEVVANKDDGIEFFGGTARVKNIILANCGDDGIDYDEGWRGYVQYAVVYKTGDRGGEHDGGTDPEDGTPYATPVLANVTSIGAGVAAGDRTITFRDNAGGEYHNSIFTEYGKGIDVEDLASGADSRARLEGGELKIMNNIFWNVDDNHIDSILVWSDAMPIGSSSSIAGNDVVDPIMTNGVPSAGVTEVTSGLSSPSGVNSWFDDAGYKGAFDPAAASRWIDGWTLISSEF